jgi:hypothetical protein
VHINNIGKYWIYGDCALVMFLAYDCDRILSIDSFKKSFRDVKSALGNLAMIASRAVLQMFSKKLESANRMSHTFS